MSKDYSMYDAVVNYDDEFKGFLLSKVKIDKGIRELVNAINQCEYLVTMSSCQGPLNEKEKFKHFPCAYVGFFVLEHCYKVAEELFILLTEKFGSRILCSLVYQADFDFIDGPEGEIAKHNGDVVPIYNIQFEEHIDNRQQSTYHEVVDFIEAFVKNVNGRLN